jgi:uncharacterized protein (DUF4415 family)
MNAKRSIRRSRISHRAVGKTDFKRLDALRDKDIDRAIASDPDAAPILDARWFRTAKVVMPERKVPVSLRLDREVLEWFKRQGRGYQSRIQAVLRAYMKAHQGRG